MNSSRNPLMFIRLGTPSNDWLHQIFLATPDANNLPQFDEDKQWCVELCKLYLFFL